MSDDTSGDERMNRLTALSAAAAALIVAGCASTDSGTPSASRAGVMCQGLATGEGLSVVRTENAVAADGGYRVPMRVADRVGRQIQATCVYAGNKATWATPLPAGLVLR
jgi:hypothetical protein